ncbi:CPBP family intramembrane glutamic endopeptidase [Bacillus pumilus]|uniref:CPBP family intramembrane glutamic endopeptidase n=1 Tax=Bacillus pumilus TaxID=1408 RepID=UPI0011AA226D|nr:type II CAAX endopeptidase family protein [Bacillus pumilus]
MSRFTEKVSAEEFTKDSWIIRDYAALLLVPLIFVVGFIMDEIPNNGLLPAMVDTSLRLLMFIAIIIIYGTMLRQHWKKFKQAWKRSVLLVIVGAIVLQILITVVRSFLPFHGSSVDADSTTLIDPVTADFGMFIALFYLALGPVLTALIEDIVFRYTLLGKLFHGSPHSKISLLILNSILFGLVHYYNFGSVVGTIPFMFAGLFLNIIYLWTRNIWHVLLIHTINNTAISIGGVFLVGLLRLLGVA